MSAPNRKKRGKPSKIDLLPEAIKAKLNELLRDGRMTQKAIVELVNAEILAAGLSEDDTLSTAGVNRYSTKMETIGQSIRESREMAEVWVAKLGSKPSGDVSALLLEMLKENTFRAILKHAEDPDKVMPVGMIKDLTLGVQRIEQAAMANTKRAKEIRQAFAEEAASAAETVAKQVGLTSDGARQIKNEILGIA